MAGNDGIPHEPLSGPLLRMAKFFLGETLPQVHGAADVYRLGKELYDRGVKVRNSEESLLQKTLWCMLQIQNDQEESDQHAALALLAGVLLAIIEDDDFYIPEGSDIRNRQNLELVAIKLMEQHYQLNMQLGVAIGMYDLNMTSSADLAGIESRIPANLNSEELQSVLTKLRIHLGQGEEIFSQHADPARRARHQARLDKAYQRAGILLARLLAVMPAADHPVLRANIVRREHRRIEVDALGAELVNVDDQIRRTKEHLAWTEQGLGEELTDENKAVLAERLREVACESIHGDEDDEEASGWFFDME